jgi:hypothetical protein
MAQNKHKTNFLNLFDGNSFDGWMMAGKVTSMYFIKRMHCRQKEEWVFYGITKENLKTLS